LAWRANFFFSSPFRKIGSRRVCPRMSHTTHALAFSASLRFEELSRLAAQSVVFQTSKRRGFSRGAPEKRVLVNGAAMVVQPQVGRSATALRWLACCVPSTRGSPYGAKVT
jgi:hypothetical protein